MSVLVHDLEVYEAVYDRAVTYKFNRTCNIDYCQTLNLEDHELQNHVKNWFYLNEWSHSRKYEEGNQLPELTEFLTFRYTKDKINVYQMLKYLQSIRYNIELTTIKKGRSNKENLEIPENLINSYNLLKKAIEEIQTTIISKLPEYEKAKWC